MSINMGDHYNKRLSNQVIIITGTALSTGRWKCHVCSLSRPELDWELVQVCGTGPGNVATISWSAWAQQTEGCQWTQICRHHHGLRIRFCKLFVTVNIPIEEYFSQISVAINIPRHQIKFFCAFLIDPLLLNWILNTFMNRFLNIYYFNASINEPDTRLC